MIASGLMEKRVFSEEEKSHKLSMFLTGRQIAWIEKSDQLKQPAGFALHIQDTVQKSEPKNYTTLRKDGNSTSGTSFEKHFSTRDRLGETLLFLHLEEKVRREKKETAINGSSKINVPEDKLVVSSMIVTGQEEKVKQKMEMSITFVETQIHRDG